LNAPFKIKLKTCNECGDKFSPPNSIRKVCQAKFMEKHVQNAERLREKRERQALREAKERIKPRSKWLKEAQVEFNRFIRLRDKHLPCISCGRFHTGQWHAGHYRSVGACPELRFIELNCHRQCQPCNTHLSGNLLEYRTNLIEKIGMDNVEWLAGKHEAKHYSIDELKQLIAHYKGKCKELLTKGE
jgi:hypothetical protein